MEISIIQKRTAAMIIVSITTYAIDNEINTQAPDCKPRFEFVDKILDFFTPVRIFFYLIYDYFKI